MLDRLPLDVFAHLLRVVHPEERIVMTETLLETRNGSIVEMVQHPDVLKVVFNKHGKRWRSFIKQPLLYKCIRYNALHLFEIVHNREPNIKVKGNALILAAENNRPDIVEILRKKYDVTLEEHEFISYLLRHIPVVSYGAIHLYNSGFRIRFTHRNKKQYLPFDFVRFLRTNLKVTPNADITVHLAAYTGKVQFFKHIAGDNPEALPFMVHECALLKPDTWAYSTLSAFYPCQLPVEYNVLKRFVYTSDGINPYRWDMETLLYVFRLVMDNITIEEHLQLFEDMCHQTFGIQEYTTSLNWVMPYLRMQDKTLTNLAGIAIQYQREDFLQYLLVHHGAVVDSKTLSETSWVKGQWSSDTISDTMLDLLCQSGVIINLKEPTALERLIEWSAKKQRNRLMILFKYQTVSLYIKQCLAFYSAIIDMDSNHLVRPSSSIYNMVLDAIIF